MIRIRTKLMMFFIILVLLLNTVAFIVYHNGKKSIDQYNYILQRLYLLNEISQKADEVYQSLNVYISEQTPENYRTHLQRRQDLKQEKQELSVLIGKQSQYLVVENYENMITSFLEESGIALDAFRKQRISVYPVHLAEAEKVLRFIEETTLELINGELARYEDFYYTVHKKSTYSEWMGISIFVTAVLLCTIFALWFSRGITMPISRLSAAAKEISAGKFDGSPVSVSTKDEMRLLTNTFNDMRSNIHKLVMEIEEKSELDKLLREMELKSLQSQIHPHFLFNVLNTISKTAYLEDADRTSELIESTAALLRYNLANLDKPTILSREVEVIEHYFFLQTARFGDRVRFWSDINESCLSLPIPHMTLQPIVENSFIHGIESYEEGAEIGLRISESGGKVVIEVSDNGVGMDEMTKKRLLTSGEESGHTNHKGHSTGLGVKNVMRRLELFYREQDVFDIESEIDKGTIITITIPSKVVGEEEGHD